MQLNMAIMHNAIASEMRLPKVWMLNEWKDRARRVNLTYGDCAVYLHLDDGAAMAANCALAELLRATIVAAFRAVGFGITEADPMEVGRYIGFTPYANPARWAPTPIKLGHLARVLDMLIDSCAPQPISLVHTTLAIYVWMAMLWRPALSFPQAIFKLTREHRDEVRWLDERVRHELRLMRAALAFLYADLARNVMPWVAAMDAAGPGDEKVAGEFPGAYCLAVAAPPYDEVLQAVSAIEVVGRAHAVPVGPGEVAPSTQLVADFPYLARTVVPEKWFKGDVPWHIFFARRWKAPV